MNLFQTLSQHRWKSALAATCLVLVASIGASQAAMKIQEIKTPGGINAWLVEDNSLPLIAMKFSFRGGAASDSEEKSGLANMMSALLDEGAGPLNSQAFQTKLEDLATRMSFSAGKDNFYGEVQTLSRNKDQTFDLLKLVLTQPRFDETPVERIRKQILLGIKRSANSPNSVAGRAWAKLAFGTHPYARSSNGTAKSVSNIKQEDLKDLASRLFARQGLTISVVGDIDGKTLSAVLDKVFGSLAEKSGMAKISEVEVNPEFRRQVIEMNIPQSVIQFGQKGLKRDDEDFIPAYILNYVLGGGGFASRLYTEVREKRGLVYSIYTYLNPLDKAGLFMGGAATKNESVAETLKIIDQELKRIATEGVKEKELEDAKKYLTGSYPLRFDTNSKIASQMLGIQMENLGIDYVTKRNDLINAITTADLKRIAKKLIKPGNLIITVVGKPVGVKSIPAGS
jgi:zinc protease